MDFILHILETFSEITTAIGWIFALAFCVSLVILAILLANSMQRLKKYGCKPGFARELKSRIQGSSKFLNMLCRGKVPVTEAGAELMHIVPDKNKHLLFRELLGRFVSRPVRNLESQPSLQSLSDEFAIVSSIQRSVSAIRSVAAILPAVGLCGTLMGMFRAFTGTDFSEPDMQKVMTGLMMDFGTALWTTILAVIIKVWADIWCSFGPQRQVSIMTDELVQLKYYVFDILEQHTWQTQATPAAVAETVTAQPEETGTAHKREEHKTVDSKPDRKKSEKNS
ncbi:MAG: MotA/TolQ/ExbB proton channel family protein [Candidatus Scalindua sp.]